MNGNNQALLIGSPESIVHAVARRFQALGLPSVDIADASEAVDVIREGRVVTFVAIDEAIGETAAAEVLTASKTLYPEAPVLWIGVDRGPERFVYAPDAINWWAREQNHVADVVAEMVNEVEAWLERNPLDLYYVIRSIGNRRAI